MFGVNFTTNTTPLEGFEFDLENGDNAYVPYKLRPETYIVPVVFLLILIVGVAGNGALVLTLLRHANMRNVPNTYVLSLALGDLLVSQHRLSSNLTKNSRCSASLVRE